MAPLAQSADVPEQPRGPTENWKVKLTVPEEFIGYVVGELNSRNGYVEAMDGQEKQVTIHVVLPAREFEAIKTVMASLRRTVGGSVERDNESREDSIS
jgi:predicted membrane GTPase involved in stress response